LAWFCFGLVFQNAELLAGTIFFPKHQWQASNLTDKREQGAFYKEISAGHRSNH